MGGVNKLWTSIFSHTSTEPGHAFSNFAPSIHDRTRYLCAINLGSQVSFAGTHAARSTIGTNALIPYTTHTPDTPNSDATKV